jgi:hypothetical protein
LTQQKDDGVALEAHLVYIVKTDVLGVLLEAVTEHVQAVLGD